MKVKSRTGFTVIELVVALAVGAVVSAMAVSFVVLTSQFSSKNNKNTAINNEVLRTKNALEKWMDYYSTSEYTLTSVAARSMTITSSDTNTYSASWDVATQILLVSYPDAANPETYTYSYIEDMTFAAYTSDGNIVKCSLSIPDAVNYELLINKRA